MPVALLRFQPLRLMVDPWQRDARFHSSMDFDELELHVDRCRELRVSYLDFFELDDIAGFGARWADGAIGHPRIVS